MGRKNQIQKKNINKNFFIKRVNYDIDNGNELNSSKNKTMELCSKIKKKSFKKKLSKRKKLNFNKAYNMETIPEKIEEIKNKPVSKINKNLNSTMLLNFYFKNEGDKNNKALFPKTKQTTTKICKIWIMKKQLFMIKEII